MYKVLLITIQNLHNYGNRLQNYALQTVLEKMNCEVTNLSVVNMHISRTTILKNYIRKKLVVCGIKKYEYSASIMSRCIQLAEFTKKNIHNFQLIKREEINRLYFDSYDIAITGSDQVWHNWYRMEDELQYYYLNFIDEDKRIAYAPSFGFSEFPPKDLEIHRKGLMGMKTLSCREQDGCELIYGLTGRIAEKVLDPTLLLEVEDWKRIERKPRFKVPDQYLLMFMLGKVEPEYLLEINRIAKVRGLQIININNGKDYQYYGISPLEFIWMIHHADIVCTDSFHGSVFTILFERDLRVFNRISPQMGNMFGRINSLVEPLGLSKCIYGSLETNEFTTSLQSKAFEYLNKERMKSKQYLHNAIISSKN